MKPDVENFVTDEAGQGLVEYSLVILLLALVAVTMLTFLGMRSNASLGHSVDTINGAEHGVRTP